MKSTLLTDFQEVLKGFPLPEDRPVLLAFSGGGDSVALFHLLRLSQIPFAAAHVNYGLRAHESDEDARFCESLCAQFAVPFFLHECAAGTFSGKTGIQEKARDIRYAFFRKLMWEHRFSGIFTAHHADDQAETVLLNLFRGTGMKGLSGIKPSHEDVYRPLLKFKKSELSAFLVSHGFTWREDSSNRKNDYTRNKLRNRILPLLYREFPSAFEAIAGTSARLQQDKSLLDYLLKFLLLSEENRISLSELSSIPISLRGTALFHLFSDYGLNPKSAEELAHAAQKGNAGKMIHTRTHRFLVDRECILISAADDSDESDVVWVYEHSPEIPGYQVKFIIPQDFGYFSDGRNAFLDADTLEFPLLWRNWERGDRMTPLGMKGSKKVSDMLTDAKTDRFKKDNTHVLLSGGNIVWLEGIRPADSSKITENTSRILAIISENS